VTALYSYFRYLEVPRQYFQIVYVALQKQFIGGLTLGANKG